MLRRVHNASMHPASTRLSVAMRIRFVGAPALVFFLIILVFPFYSCKKKSGPPAPDLVRLDELIENSQTEIESHYTVSSNEFGPYKGNGWKIQNGTIAASEKRAAFLLPESIWRSHDFRIRFVARSDAKRSLTVQAQGNEIAKYDLTPDWKEYFLKFTTRDLKKRTLKQIQFLFDGQTTGDYAQFRSFDLPLYNWGRTRLRQDGRTALSISSNASVRFHLRLPSGKPVLFFGIGVPTRSGNPATVTYAVTVVEGKKKKEVLKKKLNFVPATTKWIDERVDLTEFADEDVALELRTESPSPQKHYVAWSSPEIYNVEAKRSQPNIILMSIDTFRYDRLNDKTAPNLMALTRQSLVYRNAYCTFPSTLSSHTSVMTGLYPANHQVSRPHKEIIRTKQIPQHLQTIAQMAHQAKYFTAGITDGGFVASFFGFDRGFDQYSENLHEGRSDVATIRNAIAWLNQNHDRPFFLFLHSYEVHEPFNPPKDVFEKLFPKPAVDQPPVISMDWLDKVVRGDIKPTEQQKEFVRQCYDAEVYFFDQNFGRLMRELKQRNLDQNTVILIFADHGEQFFDRNETFGHGKTLDLEEIQVPIILHIPGRQNEERTDVVSLVDIFPTIAQIIQSQGPPQLDGLSLLEPSDSKKRWNRSIYYEVLYGDEARWGTQTREFKLVLDKKKGAEYFYDLRKDPKQRQNLAATSSRSLEMMKQLLASYVQKSTTPTDWAKAGQNEKQETGELREQLKALGYIQ